MLSNKSKRGHSRKKSVPNPLSGSKSQQLEKGKSRGSDASDKI
jgi:hypothetical protein